jgi:enamine deaminase RidA (YjgF/YER057c/UK114 family)
MDARSRRKFVNSMMAATAAAMGGTALMGAPFQDPAPAPAPAAGRGRGQGGPPRPPRPRPAGIVWISGTGIQNQPAPPPWDIKEHMRLTMEQVKTRVEALGGTMSDFLYFQVFFCLHLDDNKPLPTGSKLFAMYQQGYQDLNSTYNPFFADSKYGAPPRSCFALSWIPGNSLIEVVGAAYIESSDTTRRA